MILKRIYDETLAQASYLIGCASTGEALIVDPNRDIGEYLSAAAEEKLRITHVAETHIHADFVSGARELAKAEGARLILSGEGGDDWQYGYAADAGATVVHDGDRFAMGNLSFEVWHTPGHTPEHVSYLVTDTARGSDPVGILTGDFVFVGDVGRPDLLERAARQAGTMETAARTLFRSLRRFESLPDHLQVWPGHGAGSACGKAMSAMPVSTVGYEKKFNPALAEKNEDRFVSSILAGQPEPPTYFAEMKRINRDGPRVLSELPEPRAAADLSKVLSSAALVVDTRPASEYAAGYVPGTINIPLNKSFPTWAGWLIPYDREFYLIVEGGGERLDEALGALRRIGLDNLQGYFSESAIKSWASEGNELAQVEQISVEELDRRAANGEVSVLDVRGNAEWRDGHLPDVENIAVGHLVDELDRIPKDRPLVVHCQGGGRSAIAASLLKKHGVQDVLNLTGGYSKWAASGRPTTREE